MEGGEESLLDCCVVGNVVPVVDDEKRSALSRS
jgi:hypothetical protein